jgi:hypothetical protein
MDGMVEGKKMYRHITVLVNEHDEHNVFLEGFLAWLM